VTLLVTKCYSGVQIKEVWQDKACDRCGGREIYSGLLSEEPE